MAYTKQNEMMVGIRKLEAKGAEEPELGNREIGGGIRVLGGKAGGKVWERGIREPR